MAIKVGDRVPNATFRVVTAEGPKPLTTDDVFKGKKVVLFAVPGAFTPTCTKNHLPGYINNAAAIKAKGIDTIAVTGVNDQFVMDAWKKSSGGEGKVEFLADGNGDFAKALDLTLDASANGLGCAPSATACLSRTAWLSRSTWKRPPARPKSPVPTRCLRASKTDFHFDLSPRKWGEVFYFWPRGCPRSRRRRAGRRARSSRARRVP